MGRTESMVELVETLMNNRTNIRNIGTVAHIDHGKTTLSDSLIAAAGLINQDLAGKVQMMDYEDQEQDRGITINAANISLAFDWKSTKYLVNLIDTPGHVDFTGEVIRAMRAVDGVILLVDAVEGVMPQTETVIRQALREYVRPVLFINKVDRIIKELNANEQQMQEKFVKVIAKVNTLIERNAPEEFKQEWQVSIQKGTVAFGSAKRKWGVSAQYMQKSGINFKQVYDYLKNDQQDELAKRSPVHEVVLQMVAEHLPSPLKAQTYRIKKIWGGDMETPAAKSMTSCDDKGPITMVVTDVSVDQHAGDVATGRVYSGTLVPGAMVYLLSAHREVKVSKVGVYMGNEFVTISKAEAGNIAAIVGTKDIYAGETVATDKNVKPFESFMSNAEPVMTVSIEAKNPKDLPKLIEALRKLSKEDPNLRTTINQETGEHLLSGMGELHLEVNTYRIVNNHKIEIQTSSPIVVFHEGIAGESIVVEAKSPNKHNKFKLKVSPMPKEIYDKISELTTPIGKIKFKNAESIAKLQAVGFNNDDSKKVWAVEGNNALIDRTRGITALHEIRELVIQAFKDAMAEGPLAKEKCQGVLVELDDATLHEDSIHRGPAQVLPAVTRGIYACMLQAGSFLFEPKQLLTVTVPENQMGAASRELGGRRVQITEMRQEGDSSIIIGKAPVKELIGFSSAMRGATQGRAVWTAEYYGYELLPRDLQAETIKEIRKRKGMPEEVKTWQFFLD
ncbi:MAG: elongation factor EF-2 [Candidatus Diapherotrites archaeon]|nr:elongation factor EF-2 [Candidatus Diapherotrites archaeon]